MTALSATEAAAAPQLPVRKLKMAEPVEMVLEESSAAVPKAIIEVMISVCPMAMRPPNGSRHMLPVGRMKPVIEFSSGVVRFMLVNSRVSRDCDWLSCAPASVCGIPAGGDVESWVCTAICNRLRKSLLAASKGARSCERAGPRPS